MSKEKDSKQTTDTFTQLTPREEMVAKLNGETAVVAWKEIERFFAKGNMLLIDQELDLINVAADLSLDNAEEIKPLIDSEKIQRMPMEFVKENCKPETEFWTVVVAPYILSQLKK
ncbi:DUF2288 domain-containing protein [Kangiella sediminilitoris]|uniref:CBS domain containing protein n=1 Tax=Kangiella sediminilitoris TaxID=1144748 RepID=A0A1B3BAP2_9GAMM|nr:DUF2288 family protein [Kangiella sediminilitoris]AOE49883.1 CBS domain containing protein [Kangiella sediminilitoris]